MVTSRTAEQSVTPQLRIQLGITSLDSSSIYSSRVLKTAEGRLQKIMFKVTTLVLAETITRQRTRLKGATTGLRSIQDELSPDELLAHLALWQRYIEARRRGAKVHFKRARLFIDGIEVRP